MWDDLDSMGDRPTGVNLRKLYPEAFLERHWVYVNVDDVWEYEVRYWKEFLVIGGGVEGDRPETEFYFLWLN